MQSKAITSKKSSEIKNAGIAIGIFGDGAKRLGDITVTNKGLVWSNGNAKAAKDVIVKWDAFIGFMQSQLKTPVKAGKAPKKASAKPRAAASANGKSIGRQPQKSGSATAASATKTSAKKVH